MKEAMAVEKREPVLDLAHLPAISGGVQSEADAMADVAAGLSLPPADGYDVREADKPKAQTQGLVERGAAEVRSGVMWLAHMTFVGAYLAFCLVLCGVMALWYFESAFQWSTLCCGKQSAALKELILLGRPASEFVVGVPMWQIAAVLTAAAAVLKILIERVKIRYIPKRGRRGDEGEDLV